MNIQHWLARWSSIKGNNKNYHSYKSHTASVLFSKHLRHFCCGSQASLSASPLSRKINLKNGSKTWSLFWIAKACDEPGNWSPLLMGHLVPLVADGAGGAWEQAQWGLWAVGVCGAALASVTTNSSSALVLHLQPGTKVTLYPPVGIAGSIDGKN